MLVYENHLGFVGISKKYLIALVSNTVNGCFGVAGICPRGIVQLLDRVGQKRKRVGRGIRVTDKDGKITIDLHICVTYGTNVYAITQSIVNKVRFVVEENTGFKIAKINIYIDSMNV